MEALLFLLATLIFLPTYSFSQMDSIYVMGLFSFVIGFFLESSCFIAIYIKVVEKKIRVD